MTEIMHQLGIEPGIMLVNAVGFLLLLWLLSKFAYAPVRAILADREREVEHNLTEAEHQRDAAARDKRTLEEELSRLDERAQAIIDQARAEAGNQGAALLAEAREGTERMVAEGRIQVANAEEEARRQLRAETAQIAAELSAQALRGTMTRERQAALVDAFIEDLKQKIEADRGE